jgi:agmatinase
MSAGAEFGRALERLAPGAVALLGVPLDENSSYLRGAALAPPAVRAALSCGSANDSTELGAEPRWVDLGDLALSTGRAALDEIERAAAAALARGARLVSVGGDHSVTYPIVRAVAAAHRPVSLLHIDAHPDLYPEFGGDRYSHACPFARIVEDGLVAQLVQVGIRTMSGAQRAQAERFGVEVIDMRGWSAGRRPGPLHPLYVSIDLDALDPAHAPGVSHREPGGLSARDVIALVQSIEVPVVGADVVELNPRQDDGDLTARVAAKLVKELLARLLTR